MVENPESNVTKVKINNLSSTLTIPAVQYSPSQSFEFTSASGNLSKLMFSTNFYDFDSEQCHRVMLQEKLNGNYIL